MHPCLVHLAELPCCAAETRQCAAARLKAIPIHLSRLESAPFSCLCSDHPPSDPISISSHAMPFDKSALGVPNRRAPAAAQSAVFPWIVPRTSHSPTSVPVSSPISRHPPSEWPPWAHSARRIMACAVRSRAPALSIPHPFPGARRYIANISVESPCALVGCSVEGREEDATFRREHLPLVPCLAPCPFVFRAFLLRCTPHPPHHHPYPGLPPKLVLPLLRIFTNLSSIMVRSFPLLVLPSTTQHSTNATWHLPDPLGGLLGSFPPPPFFPPQPTRPQRRSKLLFATLSIKTQAVIHCRTIYRHTRR